MSCYQSASAEVISGFTGFILIVKVKVYGGFVPPDIEKKGDRPYDPKNVFPVTIVRAVTKSPTLVELELSENISSENEFESVEIFCGNQEQGTLIPVKKWRNT